VYRDVGQERGRSRSAVICSNSQPYSPATGLRSPPALGLETNIETKIPATSVMERTPVHFFSAADQFSTRVIGWTAFPSGIAAKTRWPSAETS
jgi:hypothetical protein